MLSTDDRSNDVPRSRPCHAAGQRCCVDRSSMRITTRGCVSMCAGAANAWSGMT